MTQEKRLAFSDFQIAGLDRATAIVSCIVDVDDAQYLAREIYYPHEDLIETDVGSLLRRLGLLGLDERTSWRFLEVESGSDTELQATEIEESIILAMRAFIDRTRAALPEAA